ncbi:ABC transporter ATP-binding protein [Undibacterium oligocarboniphilum]|uniref:sn-glycerol-3-phosphate ABC transporter ATP-binding protein UgpC n=1 Tax=Undibacterium oligocarboniphilum TaxID=666702 RepID=A0A850QDC9_9BURK|nr:sn-glycerol-3-phosphate ABC transporter ATP-binding protein UgpC [Undibacterium oligocarboniphilum]MBC3869259.1 sn-glycerol-3-phosphate ABC transporter ATP-binding protein UgpC [Undibacterium oligocarboniphilum]NVO77239.1 sn-glycerol-3-phosphate ABC transporter ATP-binding protein UgpC [Undibacterium oligocarboniphilum]
MAEVHLQKLSKSYGGNTVLQDINLHIRDGEFMVFVGPSGCGKSTLLRMIAGLEEISSGELLIGGKRANDTPPAQRGLAMVFQSYALYPHMTVFDNMAFALSLSRLPKPAIRRAVEQAAASLQITHLLDRKPKDLSGGQRQRVAIGRAIVRQPELFLFDEPLSNLDASLRVQTRIELSRLHKELGSTMIYVTHDQVEAMTLGQRIAVFHGGRIEQVGTPMELYHQPANQFVAGFLGSPAMNMLAVTVLSSQEQSLRVSLPGGAELRFPFKLPSAQPGQQLTLGVRPEHWQSARAGTGDQGSAQCSPEITVELAFSEQLGDCNLLYVSLPGQGQLYAVKTAADVLPPVRGSLIALRFDLRHCHLFDAQGRAVPSNLPV